MNQEKLSTKDIRHSLGLGVRSTDDPLSREPENVIVTLFDKEGRSRQEKHRSLMDYFNNHATFPNLYQDISMIVITSQSFHDELEDVRQAQNPHTNEN